MTIRNAACFRSPCILLPCLALLACSGTPGAAEQSLMGGPDSSGVGTEGGPSAQADGANGASEAGVRTSTPDASAAGDVTTAGDAAASGDAGALPALTLCQVSDPSNIATAYAMQTGSDWINYSCTQTCADWHSCVFGVELNGHPSTSKRGNLPLQGLAFVVDGMAGHFVFTPDGTDVVVTHAGDGGTSMINPFDFDIQTMSSIKTVSLGWEPGTPRILSGGGWFTRKDAQGTSVRAQVARPAAAIQWVWANFATGHRFGTVGSSMGTIATFGAHVWYGLESILDYQMIIGGPGFWDVNAGCGRVHIAQGHCDVDVSPCTGNPNSDYGNADPLCPGSDATNNCRVPTVMASLTSGGSAYDDVINYVGATTVCAPTSSDSRDPSLDVSSLSTTVQSWDFHGEVDVVADEGGVQPPNADQGMGEGHAMYLYASITSAKGWIDNQGTHHGDAWDVNPALMSTAAMAVVKGMGQQ